MSDGDKESAEMENAKVPVESATAPVESASQNDQAISFSHFLEIAHPSVNRSVDSFWANARGSVVTGSVRKISYPDIRLHCPECKGERTFRSLRASEFSLGKNIGHAFPVYTCGDCHIENKEYVLRFEFGSSGSGLILKHGEYPALGAPVPRRLLRLFGKLDGPLFLKGRQCENRGFGIGAFAYYRRVVENHRNDLFDEIIKVCKTLNAPETLVQELESAKGQNSFSNSIDEIKTALPQGLLIDGHNPLKLLHGALSKGLHTGSDEDCLQNAQDIRLVLSDLVDRIAQLKQEDKELSKAVQRLLDKQK